MFALALLTLPLEFTHPTLFALLVLRFAERNQTLRAMQPSPATCRNRAT